MFLKKCKNYYISLKIAKLEIKLKNLLTFCCKNLYHIQNLKKQAKSKDIKPSSYIFCDKE